MIKDKERFTILKQLEKDKTLIKMRLPGTDYERLTMITGIRTRKKENFFLIDNPKGFKEVVSRIDILEMRFEFVGNDNLLYVFRTSGGEISDDKILIRFPEGIERIQRRKHFRVETPFETKLYFEKDSVMFEMNILNISLGGDLAFSVGKEAILKVGDEFRDLKLVFPSENEDMIVQVKMASVRRVEEEQGMNRFRYGFYFIEIGKSDKKVLNEVIYELQKDYLRKRKRIYD